VKPVPVNPLIDSKKQSDIGVLVSNCMVTALIAGMINHAIEALTKASVTVRL
jgi:hypothetical protein